MTITIRAETSTITIPSHNADLSMRERPDVPQSDPDLGHDTLNSDISADVALHAQRITESRKRLDERLSMQQVATGTVAQFSAYMNAVRLQVQRMTGHVTSNLDRLGLDSAVKGMTAELDRAGTDLTEAVRTPEATTIPQAANDAATHDADWATKSTQLARAAILHNARLALQAQANTSSCWTLSLLKG